MSSCPSIISRYITSLIVLSSFFMSGCTVLFVDNYDKKSFEEVIRLSKEVDKFYGTLLDTDEDQRPYDKYAKTYVEIESELRALYIRNNSRDKNYESTKIVENILDEWVKYKNLHKKNNTYTNGNAKLDRGRMVRMFSDAASAESAKKVKTDN